jgi:hypothetical protein
MLTASRKFPAGAASIFDFSGLDVFAKPYNVAGLLVATFVMMNIGAAWFRPGNKTYWDGLVAFRGKSKAAIVSTAHPNPLIAALLASVVSVHPPNTKTRCNKQRTRSTFSVLCFVPMRAGNALMWQQPREEALAQAEG